MERSPDKITIATYYQKYAMLPIIDVRSPGEFKKGHIPGSNNIPLFTDEERAKVGTAYTRQSKEIAMNIGFKIVKPKLQHFINESKKIAPTGKVIVHCWRGGMRSAAFAQHLLDHGFSEVYKIDGGYKSFRKLVLQFFEQEFQLTIIGGYTGSGKTKILETLCKNNFQVVDLEGIAHHRGSAFGGIKMGKQPTVEQFEINLFETMRHLDLSLEIWMEDESHNIGAVVIPIALFSQMKAQTTYFLNIPRKERARYLVEEYADLDKEELAYSINRIKKRLGFDQTKIALKYLKQDDFFNVAMMTLEYYDKFYLRGLSRHDQANVHELNLATTSHVENTKTILNIIKDKRND